MKIKGNLLISIMLFILLGVLMIPAVNFVRKNPVSRANTLKSQAKDEYLGGDYVSAHSTYKMLIDSLGNTEDAAVLNYANAGFLSSQLLRGRLDQSDGAVGDSTLDQIAGAARDRYSILTGSKKTDIASMASNQLGYAILRGEDIFASQGSDSILVSALEHFKFALRQDPSNDSARYNYELVKKLIDFPETVLAETRALVAQRRYREAARVLSEGMRRDPRLRQQTEFMQRLRTVIAIDSLKTKGS